MGTASARLAIGRLLHGTGCNIEPVRYYERGGLLPAPPCRPGGGHLYATETSLTRSFQGGGARQRTVHARSEARGIARSSAGRGSRVSTGNPALATIRRTP